MTDDRTDAGLPDPVDPVDPAGEQVTAALGAFAGQVRTSPDAWDRIDARLDGAGVRPRRIGGSAAPGTGASSHRPLLVAAAFVVVVLVAGALVVRARSTDGALEVATAPSDPQALAIVAVTDDGRLVELDTDGVEVREIYRPDAAAGAGKLTGPVAVAAAERTVYVERYPAEPLLCGDVAYSSVVGQIVAIPFDGGPARVVAPVGHDPAYLPDRNWLAYALPTDGQQCSNAFVGSSIAVVDLTTGSSRVDTSEDPRRYEGDTSNGAPGQQPVVDLTWSPSDPSLYVLSGQALDGTLPYLRRVDYDARLEVPATVVGLPLPTWADLSAVDGSGPQTVAGSVVAFPSGRHGDARTDPILRSSSQLDQVDGPDGGHAWVSDGDVAVDMIEVQPTGVGPTGIATSQVLAMSTTFRIDHQALGLGPLGLSRIARDEETGDVLVTAPEVSTPDAPWASTTFPVPGTPHLFRWDGTQVREIGSGIVAAAWIRPGPRPPSATDPAVGGPDTSVSIVPLSLPTTTVPAPISPTTTAAPTDRPDDRAAIADAFRAFFEQGDRSALEGSGVLEGAIEEGSKSVENGGKGVTVTIDGIAFTGEGSAEVRFRLDQNGNYFTAATQGSAVFVDGRWKVSAATMCILLSRVSIECPVPP